MQTTAPVDSETSIQSTHDEKDDDGYRSTLCDLKNGRTHQSPRSICLDLLCELRLPNKWKISLSTPPLPCPRAINLAARVVVVVVVAELEEDIDPGVFLFCCFVR